jgi:hypothetical protein
LFFEKINKPLTNMTKMRKEKTQINKIRKEKEVITTNAIVDLGNHWKLL